MSNPRESATAAVVEAARRLLQDAVDVAGCCEGCDYSPGDCDAGVSGDCAARPLRAALRALDELPVTGEGDVAARLKSARAEAYRAVHEQLIGVLRLMRPSVTARQAADTLQGMLEEDMATTAKRAAQPTPKETP